MTWEHDDVLHAYWVEPGRFLAGEYPGDRDPAKAAQKIGLLLHAGVRTIVDLTRSVDGLAPYNDHLRTVAAERGIDVIHLPHPVPDMGVLENDDDYDAIVAALTGNDAGGPVYVHCWGGLGRTATVVGCWLVDQGHTGDEALARIDELRSTTRKGHRRAPQTDEQCDVVRRRSAR